jgi:hypothetical protein
MDGDNWMEALVPLKRLQNIIPYYTVPFTVTPVRTANLPYSHKGVVKGKGIPVTGRGGP